MPRRRREAGGCGKARRRPTVSRKVVEVAAGLIFQGGRLLITQRPSGGHLAGSWEFPGGKRQAGETFPECLRRELREELAIEVKVGRLFETVRHAYPEKTVLLKFYVCRLMGGAPRGMDGQALAWVKGTELNRYAFPPADARLLARLRAGGDLWSG